ncbi:MAG: acyl-CoA-binding protein [Euryarchaeota archaeon]|jgi:acyl-CoA-binding protein|nr:acyl-CoA-binding protein [Euryarchaeota archaeon]MBT3654012.1 acyl-CoA-binding protein [Euryarchaeota archaeon]MBT3758204.1 acyl-CoA-binding protein [Euryarchaeota archaeon]MBT4051258.1 acyl-CoA-binding protein [Euryarchaeota archaeon]MBT4346023.1 acyl-CoA-binding protein [Euryarchaeota archaeon]
MNILRRFNKSSKSVWKLKEKPSDEQLLELYALYKQATGGDARGVGDISGLIAMAKYRAWRKLRGVSTDEAMERYCTLVDSLMNSESSSLMGA